MTKTQSARVRLTDHESQLIDEASLALYGRPNKSKLLRKLVRDYTGLGPDLGDNELSEFKEAVRQLTGIARNLNQLTARIHKNEQEFNHLTPDYLSRLKAHVDTVNQTLIRYIEQTVYRLQEKVNHGNE